jgi:hypothetical protein
MSMARAPFFACAAALAALTFSACGAPPGNAVVTLSDSSTTSDGAATSDGADAATSDTPTSDAAVEAPTTDPACGGAFYFDIEGLDPSSGSMHLTTGCPALDGTSVPSLSEGLPVLDCTEFHVEACADWHLAIGTDCRREFTLGTESLPFMATGAHATFSELGTFGGVAKGTFEGAISPPSADAGPMTAVKGAFCVWVGPRRH